MWVVLILYIVSDQTSSGTTPINPSAIGLFKILSLKPWLQITHLGKILTDGEANPEFSTVVRRFCRAVDDGLDEGHVLVVQQDRDALHRLGLEALELSPDVSKDLRVQVFHVGHHFLPTQQQLGLPRTATKPSSGWSLSSQLFRNVAEEFASFKFKIQTSRIGRLLFLFNFCFNRFSASALNTIETESKGPNIWVQKQSSVTSWIFLNHHRSMNLDKLTHKSSY